MTRLCRTQQTRLTTVVIDGLPTHRDGGGLAQPDVLAWIRGQIGWSNRPPHCGEGGPLGDAPVKEVEERRTANADPARDHDCRQAHQDAGGREFQA